MPLSSGTAGILERVGEVVTDRTRSGACIDRRTRGLIAIACLAIATAMSSTDGRVTASQFGQIGKVSLQDGSSVTLAPDSKLFVPSVFNEKIRPVKVDGSAAFEVALPSTGTRILR